MRSLSNFRFPRLHDPLTTRGGLSTDGIPSLDRAPGPRGVPYFGSTFDAWENPLTMMLSAWREHGDVVGLRFGPLRYLLITEPDAIHRVLVENAKNYRKSRNYIGLKLILGEGLITSEGEVWRRQRRLAQPAFHRERLASFASTMGEYTGDLLEQWKGKLGETLDLQVEMTRLALRIVGRTLFGTDILADAEEFGNALTSVLRYADDYSESVVRFPAWVPTPKNRAFQKAMRKLDGLVQGIIDARRRGPSEGTDLLAMFMSARDESDGTGMTDRQLRDEVMTMVLAGHETTANLLTWTFYLLSKHPDVARRLRTEVLDVLGDRAPSMVDLPNLAFTKQVLEESMRLYPPVWAFERQAIEEDVVAGYRIPEGTIVGMCPYVLHRHPAHWENPEGFDPGRFAPLRAEGRSRYAYLPFGAGPRYCIGAGFAMMEAQIILAMAVRAFRLDVVAGHPIELEPLATLRPKHGMLVTVHTHETAVSDEDAPPVSTFRVAREARESASAGPPRASEGEAG